MGAGFPGHGLGTYTMVHHARRDRQQDKRGNFTPSTQLLYTPEDCPVVFFDICNIYVIHPNANKLRSTVYNIHTLSMIRPGKLKGRRPGQLPEGLPVETTLQTIIDYPNNGII